MSNIQYPISNKGAIVVLALVFGGIFLLMLSGLLGFILLQQKQSLQKAAWENSLHIAEAGMNYYHWHINHDPEDVQDGNDWCCASPPCDSCGPYEHTYYDPQGQEAGKFILEIEAKKMCDEVLGVYVTSTGSTEKYPNLKRKVKAKFASTSVAEYAYLLNSSVWAGEDRKIYGKYHSEEGGIRMDGSHNSLVSSGIKEWICTSSFGCKDLSTCPTGEGEGCVFEENQCKCQGVCGGGGPKDLWQSGVPTFDFKGITKDLNKMKELADSKGKYYPISTDIDPSGKGYHVTFNNNGTFDIKIITKLKKIEAYDSEEGWHDSAEKIEDEHFPSPDYNDVTLPAGCGLIYVEDDLWIDGTVKGKITLASADLISEDPPTDTTTFINGNLDYETQPPDGSDSLVLITEKDLLVPLYSSDIMTIRGVMVAQKGHFGRKHYSCWDYPSDCKKTKLTMYGSVVSNGRVGTKWVYSDGSWASGYETRYNYFDEKLAKDPPPLLPYVSEELQFISWEEIR